MLTKLTIRNFKTITDAEIELGQNVVFIGPNNSGKTTALQALALWQLGLRKLGERRRGRSPERRPGVAITKNQLISLPVSNINLLWKDLRTRNFERNEDGTAKITQNVRVDIVVAGVDENDMWECGLEFDYSNPDALFCRPLRLAEEKDPPRMPIPPAALKTRIAYLPPMSGLATVEPKLEMGRINVLIGEGQTAQVLRNLCYQIYESNKQGWEELTQKIDTLFGVKLKDPEYLPERGEIQMAYTEKKRDTLLDLASSGRGLQQVLLILAYLYSNPATVLLLDEPDAHLEILRQKQIYNEITSVASQQQSQVIAASHSEVILNEAGDRDVVIAFVGPPHRIDNNRRPQVLKALRDFGLEQYYQAEQTGWVLYLEGATDLKIIQAWAETINHPVKNLLATPFVYYLNNNNPKKAREHFFALSEAKNDLVGFVLLDQIPAEKLQNHGNLIERMWSRREIENYLFMPEAVYAYLRSQNYLPVNEISVMQKIIEGRIPPDALKNYNDIWWRTTKATDDFLDIVFQNFFEQIGKPAVFRKNDYHVLAQYVPENQIDPEIIEKLDAIYALAQRARPVGAEED